MVDMDPQEKNSMKNNTYIVMMPSWRRVLVKADSFEYLDGDLIFYDSFQETVAAFAEGSWTVISINDDLSS
jgi:hypothetical protein